MPVVAEGPVEVPGDRVPLAGPLRVKGEEVVLVVGVPVLGQRARAEVVDVCGDVDARLEEGDEIVGRDPGEVPAEAMELAEGFVVSGLEFVVSRVVGGSAQVALVGLFASRLGFVEDRVRYRVPLQQASPGLLDFDEEPPEGTVDVNADHP